MLNLSLLGTFEFDTGQQPITKLATQKAQALLAYLAVESRQVHKRDTLMTLLWPDYPHKSAQLNLRQALYGLRRSIEPGETQAPLIQADRLTMALNRDQLTLDVDQFEALSANHRSPQEWQQAADLYRGHFLFDFYLPDSEPFEVWAASKRAFYQRRMQELLMRLTDHYLEVGDNTAAETAVRRQLDLDNLQESAHRRLMEILARTGRRQEALAHFQTLQHLLQDELALDPEQETLDLVKAISAGDLPSKTAVPTNPPKQADHNLPHLLTSFIGREKEMAAITDYIAVSRLVTLTGVGGIGKTTLSIQVGHTLKEDFADGVWLVELASVRDDTLVGQTVFHSLGLRESTNRSPLEILLGYLQEKECLLILDNCEHVIQAVADLVQSLLQGCPRLKVLATSREILNLPGERPFPVPPLSMPQETLNLAPDQWSHYEALRLFVERARLHRPEYQVSPENLALLMQICQQLDGIPLALELAAARVDMLTTQQIAAHLEDRFRLLTTGKRTALPRQQTLRALVDWSWDLLSSSERALLRRLSVFAGGMTLEAVTAVCVDDAIDQLEVLNGLTQLVNKSLLVFRRETEREGRYHLLETIRHYGQERLAEAGEVETFRQRHLDYFRRLAETAASELIGSDQGIWLTRLDEEMDNIRTALSWAREADIKAGIHLISDINWYFWARGNYRETESWIAQSLAQLHTEPTTIKALALLTHGKILRFTMQREASLAALQESLSYYRELDDQSGIAETVGLIGSLLIDYEESEPYIRESLTIARNIGDKFLEGDALRSLGQRRRRSSFEEAQTLLEESLAVFREMGHLGAIAVLLGDLGNLAVWQGDYRAARPLMEESLALQEHLGLDESANGLYNIGTLYYRLGEYSAAYVALKKAFLIGQRNGIDSSWSGVQLGYTCLRQGNLGEAWQLLSQRLDHFNTVNNLVGFIYTLEGLASFAIHREQAEKAVSLFAWADTMRETIKDPRPPAEQADVEKDIGIILELISQSEYDNAYSNGKEMTKDQVIALAMEK